VPYANNKAGHTNHTILMTVVSIILTLLLPKGIGAQEAHERMGLLIRTVRVRENMKGQIMLS
jgi:hypothetical protein